MIFYKRLYTSRNVSTDDINKYLVNVEIDVLTEEHKTSLEVEPTIKEFELALENLSLNKSLDLDGLPIEFYKQFCPSLKMLYCDMKSINYKKARHYAVVLL